MINWLVISIEPKLQVKCSTFQNENALMNVTNNADKSWRRIALLSLNILINNSNGCLRRTWLNAAKRIISEEFGMKIDFFHHICPPLPPNPLPLPQVGISDLEFNRLAPCFHEKVSSELRCQPHSKCDLLDSYPGGAVFASPLGHQPSMRYLWFSCVCTQYENPWLGQPMSRPRFERARPEYVR
jgi:hypothetical protein